MNAPAKKRETLKLRTKVEIIQAVEGYSKEAKIFGIVSLNKIEPKNEDYGRMDEEQFSFAKKEDLFSEICRGGSSASAMIQRVIF